MSKNAILSILSIFILSFPVLADASVFDKLFTGDGGDGEKTWHRDLLFDLKREIEGEKGVVFAELTKYIEKKGRTPRIFAGKVVGGSDEYFLLSPRNTRLRPSSWDRTFRFRRSEEGSNYAFHLYAGTAEALVKPEGSFDRPNRTRVTEKEYSFSPGVEYSWDITLCVNICNLRLSSNPFVRPRFVFLDAVEDAKVASWLDEVDAWANEKATPPEETSVIALRALVLERFELFSEEREILEAGLKRFPASSLLYLLLADSLDLMGAPRGAEEAFKKAEELYPAQ